MRSRFIYALICTLIFVGGCSIKKEVDSMELPNTKAFQDEFTRSLLDSPAEVEEGYYLFESDTGGYTMLWPKDAVTDRPPFYQRTQDSFEKISFYDRNESENYRYSYSTTYSTYGESMIDSSLAILSDSVGYKGEYQEIDNKNTRIFYAKTEKYFEGATGYFFFGYIVSKESLKGLEYIYIAECLDYTKPNCSIDTKLEEEKAIVFMKSVLFTKDNRGTKNE
ncbi:hypothetical protein [Bacillus weihaiensis]|uniref:Lipoprotein YvcA n=1 Tax=Bacillus weihaiensis TaxID=1547283 RepID=A0A1L3MRM9_9BACI|nr:hypothetical protein [Bacillus weihaiensis]APH05000.1 hypothetical protein A9C19_09705 [Bacillus weihaiensis]